MQKDIEKFALQNAIKYKGKANPGAIMGVMFSQYPELKKDAKTLAKNIQGIVSEVNKLSLEEQTARLQKIAPELLEKKDKKKRELPPLENTEGGVVTRLPPEPSKYLHVGHALSFLINYIYAKKYNGKCVLSLEDTNPEKSKQEYYQGIYDDLLWLRVHVDDTVIVSKHMETFYKYAEEMIEKEVAYVCFCESEKMRAYRTNSMICEHREQNARQNLEHWKKMLDGIYKQGECVLRMTGDMDALNAVMRDPVLFRISHTSHTLQKDKYKVWPLYDFETVVAGEFTGITHIFRSSEFGKMRIELQNRIKDHLGFRKQTIRQYGRFSIVGAVTKGRVIREMIEKGEVDGWDDPRLVTLKSMRRRGINPETFYELAVEAGLSTSETRLDFSVIASINRKLIDDTTKRFFFVKDAKKINIKHEVKNVMVPNHPSNEGLGKRKVSLSESFYVQDPIMSGKVYRFMHMFNFENDTFVSEEYDSALKANIIHAVPVEGAIDVQVLMDDGSLIKGKGEAALAKLKEGEVVQFERMFFCRLDDKEKMLFVYAHD
tara:strand:- start:10677 stop:12311 length:1635 start_codon:yes stop_codon:yes gene_type:complete